MPLYEYQCKACGHRFEKIQGFSAPDETECPKCQGELERLISAPALQFKGSGFYLTDYGKAGAGSSRSEAAGGGSGDGGSSGGENSSGKSSDSAASTTAPASASGSDSGASTKPASTPNSSGSGSSTT